MMKVFNAGLTATRVVLISVGMVALTFWLGKLWGGYTQENQALALENAQNTLMSLQQENTTLTRRNHQTDTKLALLQLEHSELAQTYQQTLDELASATTSLAFYKSVVAPEQVSEGLVIDGLAIEQTATKNLYRLQFVLLQTFSQRAVVKGFLTICIEGEQDAAPATLCAGTPQVLPEGPLKYRFKFFQAADIAISLPENFTPLSLQFSSDVYRYTTKRQTFSWAVSWDDAMTASAISTD